jgi:hyperosmotically inducible periplasmic protein
MRVSTVAACALVAAMRLSAGADNMSREVMHELLLVPGYTVFDWLAYRVDQDKVTLQGAVLRPELKRDAESAVKKVEGVMAVENDIEVLPDSTGDDRIRRAVLNSIMKQLVRLQIGAVQTLHIIVKNGNVTLVGEVANEVDKQRAYLLANHVRGVAKVTNNLLVQKALSASTQR